jgi:hypothetical protein
MTGATAASQVAARVARSIERCNRQVRDLARGTEVSSMSTPPKIPAQVAARHRIPNAVTIHVNLVQLPQSQRALRASRPASRCFDRSDVDLFHFHHRLERALRGRTIRIGRCFQQYSWGDLPG